MTISSTNSTGNIAVDRHTRVRVYGPEEKHEEISFYERKKGAAGHEPVNHTAFREAERRFKAKDLALEELIVSGQVFDTRRPHLHHSLRPLKRVTLHSGQSVQVYSVDGCEGLMVLPGALSTEEQRHWIHQAFSSFMLPPNLSNLDAHFEIPPSGLWCHYYQDPTLTPPQSPSPSKSQPALNITRKDHPDDSAQTSALPRTMALDQSGIASLIRRIRWVTLGWQYDWTTKEYDTSRPPIPFPPNLATWAADLCADLHLGAYTAEAGIVNLYQPGDTLTGHVDRSEPNMEAPLLSMSLGASCIYLAGGLTRDDPVLPIYLHSGDILIMSGRSRRIYHGVPRILSPSSPPYFFKNDEDEDDDNSFDPNVKAALTLLGDARININIRQVNHY